jgi:ribonuclease G
MSKELVIGSNRHETKVAVLEDDQLVEVTFQRANEYSLAGSIHKGRVTRVLPGMQSAFVDLGLERDTFLYVSDFFEEHEDLDTVVDDPAGEMVRPEPRMEPARRERTPEDRGERQRDERRPNDRRPDGRRDRGTGRPQGDRPSFERPAVEPERAAAAPDEQLHETMGPDGEASVTAPGLDGEVRMADGQPRPDDRNRGGGDRHGRRSRRRRGRGGRGIPENKYAQPAADEPVVHGEDEHAVEDAPMEVSEAVAEVIILPGESLAKYRGKPPVTARAPETFMPEPAMDVFAEDETEETELFVTPEAAEPETEEAIEDHEEIAAEADSLELADRIFSHRDSDSVIFEEAKLDEVEHDHAAPEPPVVKQERLDDISWSAERRAAEELFANVVPIREDDLADEDDLEEAGEESTLPAVGHLSPEVEDALARAAGESFGNDPAEEIHALEGGAPEAEGPAGAQTASVRDPGSRYPHRSSRRMRRRRGGNRFGPGQGEGAVTAGAEAGTVSTVASAGAAPAVESEGRAEYRGPREGRERNDRGDGRREGRDRGEGHEERSSERPERVMPSISDLLKAGQEIIVQIAKEPLGQKGARITSHIALPGRYVVFMPSVNHLGVSRKVSSEEERLRLKRILQAHREGTTGGFIVRTAGEGVSEDEIAADMNFLYTLWLDIRQKAEKKPAPMLLHYDLDVVQRILRDQVTDEFKAIWVDNEELYENVLTFMQRFQPTLVNRVKMYTRSAPIFDAFNITQELEKALRPKVWLKSGGYLVINQTEALVAIDINTGKYVGKSNRLEDTIVKTNTEAVKEIVRQIRLRDLGGIIVVDFIDMDERKNRQKVMQALEEAMRADKAPYKILQFNDFGLVAITRKRVKQSLERTLCMPCSYCEGAGYVKSTQTVIGEVLVEAQKLAKAIEGKDVLLRVHPDVAKVLKASDNKFLEELEEIMGRPVLVKGDPTLHSDKFDLG